MSNTYQLHVEFFIETVNTKRHAGNQFIKINHDIGRILFDFIFYKKNALAKKNETHKIADHTENDNRTLIFIKGGEIGTLKRMNRRIDFFTEKLGDLSRFAFPNQNPNHLMTMFAQNGRQGKCLCKMPSSLSLYGKNKSHVKLVLIQK